MAKIFFLDSDDPPDIRYDRVFKAVFARGSPASQAALSKLISALIGRNVAVITMTANEPPVESLGVKQTRYDISCRVENGELVNVEMSLNPESFEPIRIEYYAGRLFTGQDIRGTHYDYDDLKQAYQITILAKGRFFPDGKFFHTFEYYDPINCVTLNGKSRIITLELSKLDKAVEKQAKDMTVQEHWGIFFRYLTDKGKRSKINEILVQEEGIAMASEVLMTVSKDWEELRRLESELKYELDVQSIRVSAERRGRAEGLQETAKKALAEGASVEFVSKITGLDPETIRSL